MPHELRLDEAKSATGFVAATDLFGVVRTEVMERGAEFSQCRRYRYALSRKWGPGGTALFVGLNPSTADESVDDPTIRRCIGFARSWGYGGLKMANLFAWRATDPREMMAADDPVGPGNDDALRRLYLDAAVVIAAWGANGTYGGRHNAVRAMLPRLHYLKLTKEGHPGHPRYLPKELRPVEWIWPSHVGPCTPFSRRVVVTPSRGASVSRSRPRAGLRWQCQACPP